YAPNNPRLCLLRDGDNYRYVLAGTSIIGPLRDSGGSELVNQGGVALDGRGGVTIAAVGPMIYRFDASGDAGTIAQLSEFGASFNTGATASGGYAFFWAGQY